MGYVKVADASQVVEGQISTFHTRAGRIALTRVGVEVLAFEDVCTHDDGPLAGGTIAGEVVTCPRHGAQFNMRTGAVLKAPATEPLETFPVRTIDGEIQVELS